MSKNGCNERGRSHVFGAASLFLLLLLLVSKPGCQPADQTEFEAQQQRFVQILSTEPENSLYSLAGRFAVGRDVERALAVFDSMASDTRTRGRFHGYSLMAAYLHFHSILPDSLHGKVREVFRSRGLYRGDTENHWVTYYTALYLAAQTWPNEAGTEWFNGRSSDENFREAEGWLNHWIEITTTVGQGEFDSPTYLPVFLIPMVVLYDFASDPLMKRKAQMMSDLILADFAVEHLKGNYGGGHSRDYPADITNPLVAQATRIAWLYFGEPGFEFWDDPEFQPRIRAGWEVVWGALGSYRPPDMIVRMARDRSSPYVHRERKRVRNIIRFGDEMNPPVYKYTYMTEDYVLGSLQGGILQPFQQHTWDVTFVSGKPNNTIFTLHPSYSDRELGMFFPEELKVLATDVDRHKRVYTSPDKWNSSSPFEQTFQYRNTIIVLYNITPGEQHPHIDGYFPETLEDRTEDSAGWIFCRGGKTAVAFFPLKPYEWIEEERNWRFRSHHPKNGVVVEVASVEGTTEYSEFMDRIRTHPLPAAEFDETLTVSYQTLAGDTMSFTYDGVRLLNGQVVDLTQTPLYDGPFMSADVGTGLIELRYGDRVRVLDFQKVEIRER
jgi:hypothetical protein